jgi:hypothetical protein
MPKTYMLKTSFVSSKIIRHLTNPNPPKVVNLLDLFSLGDLGIHFGQTWLHKTQDVGQILNLLDQDSGKNATEMLSCCEGSR